MPRRVDSPRHGPQVNILKKVRTGQGWRLCPVVRETNGRLRDRVRVGGRIEVHAEGVYYLEWREEGRRLRAAIPNAAEVLEGCPAALPIRCGKKLKVSCCFPKGAVSLFLLET
jgi:hypothetical protein